MKSINLGELAIPTRRSQCLKTKIKVLLAILPSFSFIVALLASFALANSFFEITEGTAVKENPDGLKWLIALLGSFLLFLCMSLPIAAFLNAIFISRKEPMKLKAAIMMQLKDSYPESWLKPKYQGVEPDGSGQ
jgi:hypothetical protein